MDKVFADLDDLRLELWLRRRNAGLLVWNTREGREIPVKEMTCTHLEKAIAHCESKERNDRMAAEYDTYIDGLLD